MTVLYERYSRPLLAFFRRMLGGDRDLAEDMLQETFLRLIDSAGSYIDGKKFTTWLYCIAYNLCKNEYRRRQVRMRNETIAQLMRSEALPAENIMFNPHEQITHKLFSEAVFRQLENLSEEKKSLFLLRYQQGLSIREIAAITGRSEGTIKSRLFYISKTLAGRLEQFHPYPMQD